MGEIDDLRRTGAAVAHIVGAAFTIRSSVRADDPEDGALARRRLLINRVPN